MYQDIAYGKTGTMLLVNDNDTIVSSANKSEIGTQMDERLTEATSEAQINNPLVKLISITCLRCC